MGCDLHQHDVALTWEYQIIRNISAKTNVYVMKLKFKLDTTCFVFSATNLIHANFTLNFMMSFSELIFFCNDSTRHYIHSVRFTLNLFRMASNSLKRPVAGEEKNHSKSVNKQNASHPEICTKFAASKWNCCSLTTDRKIFHLMNKL